MFLKIADEYGEERVRSQPYALPPGVSDPSSTPTPTEIDMALFLFELLKDCRLNARQLV